MVNVKNKTNCLVEYKRTGDWWVGGGQWYKLATWCDENIGHGNWDYYHEHFVFEKETDKALFILKWL